MTKLTFHIVKRIREQVAAGKNRIALQHKVGGQWQGISWTQFGRQMDELSLALLSFGLDVQDKVGIFANNSPRWTIADFAARQLLALCPSLQLVVVMSDEVAVRDEPQVVHWQQFVASAQPEQQSQLSERLQQASDDDLFTLIYTSGTTGRPKGVMLDYRNVAAQLSGHDQRLTMTEQDVSLCFLPLSHVFERAWTCFVLYKGATNCYLQDVSEVRDALTQVRPTVMCAVPRFYEKIFSAIHDKVASAPWHKKWLFTWAVNMGAKMAQCRARQVKPVWLLSQAYRLADRLVLNKLRALLGGRVRFMPCGGAKLDATIGRFFHALGINIKLGYGMTETTATVSCWDDDTFHPDSIGTMMPGAEVKIGTNNEILVRGPMVMRGYYNMPQETSSAFDEQGLGVSG